MIVRLVPHPETPPKTVDQVIVQLAWGDPLDLWLEYSVTPSAGLLLPPETGSTRADELWKSTCFELFVRTAGSDAYTEFNFSPSFQWAAYDFESYRSGMRHLECHDPEITVGGGSGYYHLAVEALPQLPASPLRLGLSAVIEEIDGTISYWALRHPHGKPNFHHPDCFALEFAAARPA